jgi:hypothetical protein
MIRGEPDRQRACRRAHVRQGQAFGGAEEAPSLTATARDGDGNMRSGRKNARGADRTKEWNDKRDKNGVGSLTKPNAGDRHVRFDERGWETGRCRMAQVTAPILDSLPKTDRTERRFSRWALGTLGTTADTQIAKRTLARGLEFTA